MLTIVGASGKKRHGKDSVGQILAANHNFQTIAFADPIKKAVMEWYGFTYEQVYGDDKEVVDTRWGITPRHAMQQIGTEVGRLIHGDTWVRKCLMTIEAAYRGEPVELIDHEAKRFSTFTWPAETAHSWVICDCRFTNEAEAIKAAGGWVIKVTRPSLGASRDQHASETNVDLVKEDYTIVNDGTLVDLARCVAEVHERILAAQAEKLAVKDAIALAFDRAMQGFIYGHEERANAEHWFRAGFQAGTGQP